MTAMHEGTRPLAVVTGASSGIGRELAHELARRGYDLVVVAHEDRIESAAEELRAAGAQVEAVRADLATYEGVEALWARLQGRAIDALLLNAGVGVGGYFLETDLGEELRLIGLNVASVVHLAKRVLPGMVSRKRGRVLITSSIAGEMPGPFEAVYAASKTFDLSFAYALRNELKDAGVTVTALQPGPTDTAFFDRAGMQDTKVGQGRKDDPASVAKDGIDAMLAGRDNVVAGSLTNWLQSMMSHVTPASAVAQMHRQLTEPGSGRK